jgi:hypothetical protein
MYSRTSVSSTEAFRVLFRGKALICFYSDITMDNNILRFEVLMASIIMAMNESP